MSLAKLLFILFVTVPLLELYLLIQAGGTIGVLPTVLLCLLTAALGAALFRRQGLQTITNIQIKLQRRELPAADLLGGGLLLVAGALLLTPGFITDAIGFLCLIPGFRKYLADYLLLGFLKNRGAGGDGNVIVEGEFWSETGDGDNKKLP